MSAKMRIQMVLQLLVAALAGWKREASAFENVRRIDGVLVVLTHVPV